MKITGKTIRIKRSAADTYKFLSSIKNYKQLLPSSIQTLESGNDQELRFSLMGLPQIAFKIGDQSTDKKIVLESTQKKYPFSLALNLVSATDQESELCLDFEGAFNPLVSMMAEKPLQKFIDSFTEKINEHFNR